MPFVPNTGPSGNPSQPTGTVDGSTFFQLESVPAPTSLVLLTSGVVFGLFGGRMAAPAAGAADWTDSPDQSPRGRLVDPPTVEFHEPASKKMTCRNVQPEG